MTISYISCIAGRLFTPEPPGSPMLVEAKIIILGSQVLWGSWLLSWNELPNPSFSVKSLIQYIDHLLRKPVNFADWKIASLCFSPSGELRKQLSQFKKKKKKILFLLASLFWRFLQFNCISAISNLQILLLSLPALLWQSTALPSYFVLISGACKHHITCVENTMTSEMQCCLLSQ